MNRIGDNLCCTSSNKEIVQSFVESGVEFVLIGGLAIAWYCSDRQADDMDLLLNPTRQNAERVVSALSHLTYTGIEAASLCHPGLQIPLKTRHYAELLTPLPDGPSYTSVADNAVVGKVMGVPVLIASPNSLIQLKEIAVTSEGTDKEKHQADIERLRKFVT